MSSTRPRIFCILSVLLFSQAALSSWTATPSRDFPLGPPPNKSSAEYKKDLQLLQKYQAERSKESCRLGNRQEHPTFQALFAAAPSPLSEYEAQLAEELVEKVMKLSVRVAGYHKGKFRRPRPYDADPEIRPCVKKPGGSRSYPSSHAAASSAGSCILAQMFPEKAEEISVYGSHLGELRTIVGVHYPSDVNAGQDLGTRVCQHLLQNEEFLEAMAEILKK